jgi:hypothetical protein
MYFSTKNYLKNNHNHILIDTLYTHQSFTVKIHFPSKRFRFLAGYKTHPYTHQSLPANGIADT